jgi:hypothetical protein
MITEKDVITTVKLCMKELRKKKYELNLTPDDTKKALRYLKTYNRTNGSSYGGFCLLKINLKCWQFGNKRWSEYKRFNDNKVIGAIDVTDDNDILLLLVAHEVSHFVQYTFRMQMPKYMAEKSYSDKGHGECFQTIYRYLREGLVNPSIKAKMEYTGVAA